MAVRSQAEPGNERHPSYMTQNNLPRTPPADRHEIADAATDNQPRRSLLMAEITIGIEDCSGIKTVSILKRHRLATMQVPRQNEVKRPLSRCFPDARIVRAQNLIIALRHRRRVGARNGNQSRTVRNSSRAVVNPLPSAAYDHVLDEIESDLSVVVAAHGKDWRQIAKRTDQIAKFAQF